MSDIFSLVKTIPTPDVMRAFFPTVELKRGGSGRHKALCPFHAEHTPSFTVFEDGWKVFWMRRARLKCRPAHEGRSRFHVPGGRKDDRRAVWNSG